MLLLVLRSCGLLLPCNCSAASSKFVSEAVSESERPDLASARVVVSGGRGMKNGENFAMLEKLADKVGGAGNPLHPTISLGIDFGDVQQQYMASFQLEKMRCSVRPVRLA